LLASAYCFFFTGKKVLQRLKDVEHRLTSNGDVSKVEVSDIHASTSSLKSFTTSVTSDGIEECRKACGGHGFLMCSGLPELLTTYLQNPTVEGDNHMLPQQVAKVLIKLVDVVSSGKDVSAYDNCDSILLIPSIRAFLDGRKEKCPVTSAKDFMNLQILLKVFGHRSARLLVEISHQLQRAIVCGKSISEAWNEALIQMSRMSRAYSLFVLLSNVIDGISQEAKHGLLEEDEIKVLQELARLFAHYWMEKEIGDFLEDGYMTAQMASWIRSNVVKLLDNIRPNAVALVDAFDFTDFRLKSALGRFDGNVYPAILDAATRDPLNKTDPGPGYEPHLRRLIQDGAGIYSGTVARL
jgi:acyl-CoA oxidase